MWWHHEERRLRLKKRGGQEICFQEITCSGCENVNVRGAKPNCKLLESGAIHCDLDVETNCSTTVSTASRQHASAHCVIRMCDHIPPEQDFDEIHTEGVRKAGCCKACLEQKLDIIGKGAHRDNALVCQGCDVCFDYFNLQCPWGKVALGSAVSSIVILLVSSVVTFLFCDVRCCCQRKKTEYWEKMTVYKHTTDDEGLTYYFLDASHTSASDDPQLSQATMRSQTYIMNVH
eukprot:TRINITY_DN92907_c0_g1_i1.p1 TRINITY_DN92907_c0_g1~~TRINITY_DN92907_c0_g1_i1.p1  ORF type:complete len:232 (-),score=27.46 TRINITY_DN92907_c0_g1_i1:200-895(-)